MMTTTRNRATTGKMMALGVLMAALMAASLLAASQALASTTFTVNSTEDHSDAVLTIGACDTGYDVTGAGGQQVDECTLRAAMEQANYTPGADTINFAVPGSGVRTITPATELPTITEAVTIDGYSQPGAQANTKAVGSDAVLKIELSGASAQGGHGLIITASNSTVEGLVINRFGEGIRIAGSGATGNKVVGNYVGTDASGTQALGNGDNGVAIGGAPNNTIGGATPAARNVISGNNGVGVGIDGANATGNKVTGNYMGTARNGTAPLGNGDGVFIDDAPNNTVGGTTTGVRNVISGNDSEGVVIAGSGATGNKVVGNYLGTGASGQGVPGHDDSGVTIVDATDSVVGGTEAGARNVITGGVVGVYIEGAGATGNRVLSNSIFANAGSGIDLYGTFGPTPNDPGDTDTGPNGLQNKPVVTSAKTGALKTTINARLNSTPNKTFKIQFFSNPSGTSEGKKFIGQKSVTTDGSGNVVFSFSPAQKVGVGRTVTATATNPAGSTSEFSAPRSVATS